MWAVRTGWARRTDRRSDSYRLDDLIGYNCLHRAAVAVDDCVVIIIIISKDVEGVVGTGDALMNSGKAT